MCKSKVNLLASLFLFFIFFITLLFTLTPFTSALFFDKNIDLALNNQDRVRVIVLLKEPQEVYKGVKFSEAQLKTLRRSFQDNVISGINKRNIKYRFSIINGFSAYLNASEIEILKQNSLVKAIVKSKIYKAVLQDSVPLINASNVWKVQVNGVNLTGKYFTACVIDTGVNYSHPDLGGCYGNNNASSNCKVIGGYDFVNNDFDPLDDNGHGTHVSGIIAANGNIKGVSPDAKIIAIKALDAGGSGTDSDIIAGIDWCVNNASKFNITVISMSLGIDCSLYPMYCYNTYCDSDSSLTSAINSAIANNISVIVASGNNGNTTHISDPACIQNATAVAATNKNDIMASFSNRNALVDLVAPGVNINSTTTLCPISFSSCTGLYAIASGTSMATPHVSGAFILLAQYKKLEKNITLTPHQIENALKNTGKEIYDSATSLTFPRIDIYSALLSLDETPPNITLIFPQNNTITINRTLNFTCNLTDNLGLKNVSIYIWNSTGKLKYLNNTNMSGINNKSQWNITLDYGNWFWNCYACDLNNNCNFSSSNFSLRVGNVIVTLTFPSNNSASNKDMSNFTCNVSTRANTTLKNVTFFLWNSTSQVYNETHNISGLINSTNFSLNFTALNLSEAAYFWNCLGKNNISEKNFALHNFTYIYDKTPPSITIVYPKNNSWINGLKFNLSVNENLSTASSCIFEFSNTNRTMERKNSTTFYYVNHSISESNSSHDYNTTFYCNDTAGNINKTGLIFFGVEKTPPSITLISPSDGYTVNSNNVKINFIFNTTDKLNYSWCKLIISGSSSFIVNNQTEVNNGTNYINYSFTIGNYYWKINCSDIAGNIGTTNIRSLKVHSEGSSGSSSGSSSNNQGGGGGGIINLVNNTSKKQSCVCPPCEQWSKCSNHTSKRLCYKCENNSCIPYEEKKNCSLEDNLSLVNVTQTKRQIENYKIIIIFILSFLIIYFLYLTARMFFYLIKVKKIFKFKTATIGKKLKEERFKNFKPIFLL